MKTRSVKQATTARKKPLQKRAAITVDSIIEAAARILETQGHAGYNTNDIAQLAGVSVGSLYQYFPNKDAITNALLLREMKALTDAILADVEGAADTEALEQMIETAVKHQLERSALARLLEVEETRLPPDQALEEERARLLTLVKTFFQSLVLSTNESNRVAEDVFAIVRGMVDSAGNRGETDAIGLATRIKWAVFGYLRSRDASLGLRSRLGSWKCPVMESMDQ